MKSKLRKITSAHVISVIALFVALGGTVYAAGGFNGKLIRKGSIPGNRLKANSLTGGQIAEESLGTVPAATSASKATEAVKAVEATKSATATNASHADNATNATHATKADSATSAASAVNATNADQLGHAEASTYLQACSGGSLRGAARIDIVAGVPTVRNSFTCNNIAPTVSKVPNKAGVYQVGFPGIPDDQLAVVSDTSVGVFFKVSGQAANIFNVSESVANGTASESTTQFTILVF
jgi:hypothetical protein